MDDVALPPLLRLNEPFHVAWLANEGVELPLRLARAQAAEMAAALPVLRPGELIVGGDALSPIVSGRQSPFGNGIRVNRQRAEDLKACHPECALEVDALLSYWTQWEAEHGNWSGLTCHASLAYERVLTMGLDGLRAYVREWQARNAARAPESGPWYEALVAVLDGVSAFIGAHARAAREMAAGADTPRLRAEMAAVARHCEHVAHQPPRTFHEAVQLFYILFLLCGHDSPGPLDRTLYPALKRDLERGAITLDGAQEIVDCLWLKFEEKTAYGATLGGQLRDGSDAVNELSFLCLDAIRRLRILSPRTAVRWHPGLDPRFFDRACEVVAEGASYPAFVNDEAMVAAAVERGTSPEDAREYTFVGCGQTYPHGRGHGSYEDVIVNAATPLVLALYNGSDPVSGRRLGPETGTLDRFRTYEQFEAAYRTQMDAMIAAGIRSVNERRRAFVGRAFDLLRSLLTYSCVERGLDWHAGGADYSEGMVDVVGLATVTDSLVVIKEGVFGRGLVSLPELAAILDRNWEGAEALRQCFLRRLPKFGNDSPDADAVAEAESARINAFIKSHRTCFGGPWGMDIIGWSGAVTMGEQTGATPDGRRARDPLADCAGPAQGRNVLGLTATLNSVARLPHRSAHGPFALSLRFPKGAVKGAEGRARLRAVVESYFAQGGQQVQISIASTEEMRAAQQDPEAHRSLIVRVGGFSAYFASLDKRWQDDMIARSESV